MIPKFVIDQSKKFTHNTRHLSVIPKRCKDESGMRYYSVEGDDEKYYSITTVLSVIEKPEISQWKEYVGKEYADKVSKTATKYGTNLHKLCELYLTNQCMKKHLLSPILYKNFKAFVQFLNKIDNIVCLETPLYSKKMHISGTVDCIAEYDGVLSVIDFKTSKTLKYESQIKDYFAQASAYAIMYKEMTGVKIEQLVILISVDGDAPQAFIKPTAFGFPHLAACRTKFFSFNGFKKCNLNGYH